MMGSASDLEWACRSFVTYKDTLDAQGRLHKHAPWVVKRAWWLTGMYTSYERGWSAVIPDDFLAISLPFWKPSGLHRGDVRPVEPDLVIAGTFRNYPPDPSVIKWSDDAATRNEKGDNAVPWFYKVGQLPLFVAIEGKNRVSLFKEMRVREMKAVVMDTPYPSPDELELVELKPFGQFALRFKDRLEVLPFPRTVVPILELYGVAYGRPLFRPKAPLAARKKRLWICSRQMIP